MFIFKHGISETGCFQHHIMEEGGSLIPVEPLGQPSLDPWVIETSSF